MLKAVVPKPERDYNRTAVTAASKIIAENARMMDTENMNR